MREGRGRGEGRRVGWLEGIVFWFMGQVVINNILILEKLNICFVKVSVAGIILFRNFYFCRS